MPDLNLKPYDPLYPMRIHPYEELLKDQNASVIDKINSIIDYLNSVGKLTNDVVKNWNTVYNWTMNDGLKTGINNKLEDMLAKGEFDPIINTVVTKIGDITTLTTTDKTNLTKAINELVSKIGDLTTLTTPQKDTIVHSINSLQSEVTTNTNAISTNTANIATNTTNIASNASQLADIVTVNVKKYGIVADGVTDQTTAIVNLFTTTLKDFTGVILIPFNTKFNITEVFKNSPLNSVIEDKSMINMYYSQTYRQRYYNIGGGDKVDNDFMYQILSGHHPAILVNNLGTSGSDSALYKRGSILFAHGFNADGTQKNHMMIQSYNDGYKWLFALRALNLFGSNTEIDSTVFMVDELGNFGINGQKGGYNISFQNSSLDSTLSYLGGIFNKNNNSKSVWSIGSKKVDSTEVLTSLIQNPDGRFTIEKSGNAIVTIDDGGFTLSRAKTLNWRSISGATPDVSIGIDFWVSNAVATNMTDLIGNGNQEVRLVFQDGNTTLVNGLFKLNDGVNWNPTAYSSITFVKNSGVTGAWIEVARSQK